MPREAQVRAGPLNVVGGSFAGLMCGIALRELGHRVRILEKDEDERQSHMAGVCLGLDAKQFLSRYDRHTTSFTHTTTRIQVLKNDKTQMFFEVRRDITSWDTFYFRLRSCFDGYISSHNLSPPIKCENMELCSYESRKELLDIERVGGEDFGLELTVLNRETNVTEAIRADLVIGADGPSSFIRAKYSPGTERQYVGYVAWRGTVPENELSTATRETCNSSATVVRFHRHHCIMYMIPGANGSLKQGERLMNFLWYTNESAESLTEIMMDGVTGHVHHNIVPAGHVRKDVWAERLQRAKVDLSGPFLEVVLKIKRPFIQVITEFCSSKAVFEEGRVLLVGDSVSLIRPQ
ncbi:hypothetical protein NUW58_g1564 [Xylaria curta]|uniref:Uncharacterized protein n=1 Tax=Xylaria curta TaxID=42375 RepID=A0ACC1PJR6_9PEZI|nr:hypothetical protein NUW58_g1564 [Xylaria curta]